MKYVIFPVFLTVSVSFSQSSSVIDSLKHVVRTAISDSIRASAYADLSWNYAITRTKLDSAGFYADSLRLISVNNDDQEGVAKSHFYYGVIGRFGGDHYNSLKHLQNYVNFHQKTGDSVKMAAGLYQVGVIESYLGNYPEALVAYHRILRIYKSEKNLYSIGFTLNSIANLQKKMNRFPEAISSYQESIAIHEQLDNQLDLSNSLGGLGNTYRMLHEFEKAKIYLLRVLEITISIDSPNHIASVHENLGNLFYEMGEYIKALDYHLKSLKQRKNLPSQRDLAISHNKVGNTYRKLNQTSPASEHLLKSLELAKEIGSKPILVDSYKSLKELYRDMGNMNMAFKYQDLHATIKDSIFNSERNRQMIALETKYQTAQKDQEIALLTKKNEVKEVEAQNQATLQNALLIGLALLAIIAGLIFYTLRSRLKNQKLVATKNEEIRLSKTKEELGTLEMKALRAQMNPHFLFNCMNSINRMIMAEENEKASKYLSKFSKLVRLMLENSEQPKVSLQDELQMLESYIQLESIRFKNKLDYHIEVEKSIDKESTYLPPMVLQPFVENAIWHGLMHKKSRGHLEIDIKETKDELHCTITDNGVGREKSLLLQTQNGYHKKSMGIKITAERLRLLTKEKIKKAIEIVDLKDKENKASGTQVNVSIPIS